MTLTAYKCVSDFESVMVNRKSEWRGRDQMFLSTELVHKFQCLSVQNAPRFCKTYFRYYNIEEN